jgi:hypothetical protein
MSMPMQRLVTFDDYLAAEGTNERKAEYVAGHVRAMTGGSIAHARMIHSLAMAIGPTAKQQGCETFTSDAMDPCRPLGPFLSARGQEPFSRLTP